MNIKLLREILYMSELLILHFILGAKMISCMDNNIIRIID